MRKGHVVRVIAKYRHTSPYIATYRHISPHRRTYMLAGARRLLAPTAHARSHGTSRSIIKRSEGVVMFAIMLIWTDCAPTYASKAIGGHHAPPPPPRPPQFAWMCASPHASQRGRPERREHRLGHTGTSFTVNTRARRLPIATDRDTARHIARYREISPEIAPVYAPTTPLPQGCRAP